MTTRPDLASPRPFVRCDRCNRLRPVDAACCEPVFEKVRDVEIPEAVKRAREERSARQASRVQRSGYASTLATRKPEPISDNGTDNHTDIAATAPDMTADTKRMDKEADIVADKPADTATVRTPTVHESAVALGQLGGIKGGPARARMLTVTQRHEIAQQAAEARWKPVRVQIAEGLAEANYEKEWGETRDCPNDLAAGHWARLSNGRWVGYCQRCGRWIGQRRDLRLNSHIVWSARQDELWDQAEAAFPDEHMAEAYFMRLIEDSWPDEPYWSRPVEGGEITR